MASLTLLASLVLLPPLSPAQTLLWRLIALPKVPSRLLLDKRSSANIPCLVQSAVASAISLTVQDKVTRSIKYF